MKERKKPELLMPAGSLEVLKVAFSYGADAVYIGGEAFGLRAKAKNFTLEEMAEAVSFAHVYGKKVYVTANIFAHNDDLKGVRQYFQELSAVKPDALIISDPGVFAIAGEVVPEIERHISTQANTTNYESALFWHRLGAKRIVTAREMSLAELAALRANIPDTCEIETFVHGSMCISYSGRCLLSNVLTGRDANAGACTHPCRWKYFVSEETRPGEYFPVFENDRGTFIFNSKDLCMIEHIPELVKAGIDSFKVEGRMKNALYAASVARAYRRAIDDYFEDEAKYEENTEFYRQQAALNTNRDFTTGFFFGKPGRNEQIYDNSTYIKESVYLGISAGIDEQGRVLLTQKNKFSVGDTVIIMKPDGTDVPSCVLAIYDDDGNEQESAPHARQSLHVLLREPALEGEVIRKDAED